MNHDGSGRFEVTVSDQHVGPPVLSPDNSMIAYPVFMSSKNGPGEIYVVGANGENPHSIAGFILAIESWKLSWSPDGNHIVFESDSLHPGRPAICIINADGTGFRELSPDYVFDREPAWSHDGTRIAFTRYLSGFHQIFVMNADGSNPHNISNSQTEDTDPCWSPDDNHIAYVSLSLAGADIYAMNVDGSNKHNVSNTPDQYEFYISWGPWHR